MDPPQKILLVDDDRDILKLLERALRPLGCELSRAESGAQALAQIELSAPDLMLLDLNLADVDGAELVAKLRAREDLPYLPVVIMTGSTDAGDHLRGLEAGADDFLEKPINLAILEARIKNLLRLKAMTMELAARNAELLALQQVQRELTNFIVHDLRIPMAVIQSNVRFAARGVLGHDEDVIDALEDAQIALLRMKRLTEDLLLVSRLEQAQIPLSRQPVALAALVEEVREFHARQTAEKRIAVNLEADPELVIRADRQLLLRVIDNLFENALRHAPTDGHIGVRTELSEGRVTIRFGNDGPPIPAELRARIFQKFSAAGPSGGVGLGLHFCQRVLVAHGGSIRVDDSPRWPAQFILDLPA